MTFAMFFLGEYANMILVSSMMTIFFLGGYLPPFGIKELEYIPGIIWFLGKIAFLLFVFLWIRATLPRYRYDQLMHLGWKVFLPLSLFWVILVSSMLIYTGNLPNMIQSPGSDNIIPANAVLTSETSMRKRI